MSLEMVITRNNDATAERRHDDWIANARENRKIYRMHGNLRNVPLRRSFPILICGAGPSLDEQIPVIRYYRQRFYLLAVDMAYPALMQRMVEPDFVVSLDPQPCLAECFRGMKNGAAQLWAATVTHPDVIAAWRGRIQFYNIYDPNVPTHNEICGMYSSLPRIPSRFHVGEFAVSMAAISFRFRTIGIAGVDLCLYGGQYYAAGAPERALPHPSLLVDAEDGEGKPVKTTMQWLIQAHAFARNYEQYRENSEIYNLSKGILPLPYRADEFAAAIMADRSKLRSA